MANVLALQKVDEQAGASAVAAASSISLICGGSGSSVSVLCG